LCKYSCDGAAIGTLVVLLLPLSSSMDDGEVVNNDSGRGAVAAVAAVENEDGVQLRWRMKMAFNGSGSV
jgi:hypothetical protein